MQVGDADLGSKAQWVESWLTDYQCGSQRKILDSLVPWVQQCSGPLLIACILQINFE